MYRLTVVYDHPADPEAFVRHYRDVHAVLAQKMPGLTAYQWGVAELPDGSRPPHFLTATLDFESKDAALAALGSPEGQAGAADMVNLAPNGEYSMSFSSVDPA